MYNVIYDDLVDAGIAVYREKPVFTDREGNNVNESDRFGLIQDILITHPHYLIFADESGFNTPQKDNGAVGGERLVVGAGTVPQRISSTSDHQLTMFPFTAASGEAVCCVLIFQNKTGEVPLLWQHGHDKTIDLIRDDDGNIILEANTGEGKAYPGRPTCKYNGKIIPCLMYASKSGGITGAILVSVLTEFDSRDMFPRVNGLIPGLVVDGHQSRLDPVFVGYINNPAHPWKVCLGVPYAMSLWQVGDASEQNGRAETMWYHEKANFVS